MLNDNTIRTESDYKMALHRIDEIFNAKPNTPEGDELEILGLMVDEYEKHHYPIDTKAEVQREIKG